MQLLTNRTIELNRLQLGRDKMRIIDLAQAVENDYIGSPCGQLDQIMIHFAKAGMGTHYNPATRAIKYVPLSADPRNDPSACPLTPPPSSCADSCWSGWWPGFAAPGAWGC